MTLKKSELEAAIKKLIHTADNIAGLQGLLRIASAYDVWRENTQAFAISRWLYALTFVAIVSCGVQIFALVSTILFVPDAIFNKNKYLTYLIMCELGILLWVPFQSYSIERVKSLLFSPEFRGFIAGINIMVYLLICLLSMTTISSIYRSATKKYQPILLLFLLGSLGLALLGSLFGVFLIDNLFGISSTNPLTPWFAICIFFVPIFFLLVRLIDLRVENE